MEFYIILWIFLISLTINFIFFMIAFIFKTAILTDIIYYLSFIYLSVIIVAWKQNFSPVQISLFVLYNIWALRLGSFLLLKIIKHKVEYRFDKIIINFWKFSIFSILQGISVFMISIPTVFALSLDIGYFNSTFNNYLLIFIMLAILFLVIETIADWQKFRFSLKKKHDLFFINYGLWKDCRHPNYLAEIGFWYMMTALFICDLLFKNINSDINYLFHLLWLLSPLYFNVVVINITDIPIWEVKQWQRFHSNEDYYKYLNETSCVMCYIGKKGPINKVKKLIYKK